MSDHHHHSHSHDHHHHHHVEVNSVNRSFIIGILLNFLFVLIEVVMGLKNHSLSLLSDAGHNLADVGALALSLLAYKLLKVKSSDNYTYGYRKISILSALFNAVVLLCSVGAIVYEAIHRLLNPTIELNGFLISIVAGIGILINGFTAYLFMRGKESDINIKAAYMHLLSDALVSFGLVLAGFLIYFTNWYWLDPLFSIILALIIILSTWRLFKQSFRLSIDGVPAKLNISKIKEVAMNIPGVKDIHHLHVWAISTKENALTAHVLVEDLISLPEISQLKKSLKHEWFHQDIQHITIEIETKLENCSKAGC